MDEQWHGFAIKRFEFEGQQALIVFPQEAPAVRHLAIKTEYWDAFPDAIELSLLKAGFHLSYIANSNRWGTDVDLDRKARFIHFLVENYNLLPETVPIGMSCGGLIAIKFAARYPDLVSCLYLDAPVLNYMSCPCGFGLGNALNDGTGIQELLNALHMQSISQLIGYRDMPLDKLPQLIAEKIPVALVAGGADFTVPFCENGKLLKDAYEKTDIPFFFKIKPECHHHPHGLKDNHNLLQFILACCNSNICPHTTT